MLKAYLAACLLTLTGCSTVPRVDAPIPIEALADCQEPPVDARTNGGLAQGVLDLKASLKLCNKDKAILREWHAGKVETKIDSR